MDPGCVRHVIEAEFGNKNFKVRYAGSLASRRISELLIIF